MTVKWKYLYSCAAVLVVHARKMSSSRYKQVYSATERNKQPILEILLKYVDKQKPQFALEVASGTGQHVTAFAKVFSNITWQPTDIDSSLLDSINAYIDETGLENVHRPLYVDITQPVDKWTECPHSPQSYDLVLCVNLIHISPFQCTIGLFRAAGLLLKPGGLLITYGPYAMQGKLTPESNVRFNETLKAMNAEFGIRDVDELTKLACDNGLGLKAIEDMPANNKTLIFQKLIQ